MPPVLEERFRDEHTLQAVIDEAEPEVPVLIPRSPHVQVVSAGAIEGGTTHQGARVYVVALSERIRVEVLDRIRARLGAEVFDRRVGKIAFWVLAKRAERLLDVGRRQAIVGVEAQDELAVRRLDSAITRDTDAAVRLREQLNRVSLRDRDAVVG